MPDLVGKGLIEPNRYRLVEGYALPRNALDVLKHGEGTPDRLIVIVKTAEV